MPQSPQLHNWKPLYFHTQDTALALALSVVGETLVCIWNDYNPEQLQSLGCTARAAWEKGIQGTVRYYFEPTESIELLKAAFYDECSKIRHGGDGSTLPTVEPEDAVRIIATALVQRAEWSQLWKKSVPTVSTREPGGVNRVPDEDGTGFRIDLPGMKTISINAPREVKEKLERMR